MSIASSGRKLLPFIAIAGIAGIGVTAHSTPAEAWWRGGWCCGVGVGVVVPPIVVAPPVYAPPPVYYAPPPPAYYAPPPAYYAPPQRVWVPAHWQGGVWIPAHWG
jgi:hypothetical protein